jgi:peptidoglycan/LPS O-acetylase OafA/YrhL
MLLIMDMARGFAALWVFIFHAKGLFGVSSATLYSVAEYGSLGVPMFFVISGFVITYSAESMLAKDNKPFIFLKKRFLRIYPVFWFSILVVLAMPYIMEFVSLFKTGVYEAPANILTIFNFSEWVNFITLTKVFFAVDGDLQGQFNVINSVYWSLAIEIQFYIVMFLAMLLGRFYRYAILIVTLVSLVNIVAPLGAHPGLFLNYWPMFSCGIVLAYMTRFYFSVDSMLINNNSKLILYSLPCLSALLLFYVTVYVTKSYFVFSVLFTVFLWCAAPLEGALNRVKKGDKKLLSLVLDFFLFLGVMSYSVYLLHAKIFQLPEMFVRQIMGPQNILYGLLVIILTLLLCVPFHCFIERKFMSKTYEKIVSKVV